MRKIIWAIIFAAFFVINNEFISFQLYGNYLCALNGFLVVFLGVCLFLSSIIWVFRIKRPKAKFFLIDNLIYGLIGVWIGSSLGFMLYGIAGIFPGILLMFAVVVTLNYFNKNNNKEKEIYERAFIWLLLVIIGVYGLQYRYEVEASKKDKALLEQVMVKDDHQLLIKEPSKIMGKIKFWGGVETSKGEKIPISHLEKTYQNPGPEALDPQTGEMKFKVASYALPKDAVRLGIYRLWVETTKPIE